MSAKHQTLLTYPKEKAHAQEYLAQLVAQFVIDQMPLADLLGEERGKVTPPQEEVIKLQHALADAGFERAAQALASHPDLK